MPNAFFGNAKDFGDTVVGDKSFGEYIKKFCDDTQFVLITHRRGTMEVAERLYGITMPERGISRALPFDASEIENKQKELLS